MVGEQIILVNRTQEKLTFQADGHQYELEPGDNYGFQEGHVRFAINQNPVMGTEDYHTLQFMSKVGAKSRDGKKILADCDEIPESLLEEAKQMERFDIFSLDPRRQRREAVKQRVQRGRIGSASADTGMNALAVGNG